MKPLPHLEGVLNGKHVPPLAAYSTGDDGQGHEITQRGRGFYHEHHATHPDVHAPHPDGAGEPWLARTRR